MANELIENVDPLTTGEVIHGEDIKGASTYGLASPGAAVPTPSAPAVVAPKPPAVRNSSEAEQDRVAKGRKE